MKMLTEDEYWEQHWAGNKQLIDQLRLTTDPEAEAIIEELYRRFDEFESWGNPSGSA